MAGSRPHEPAPGASVDAPSGGLVVLVVDDSADIRELVVGMLARSGIHAVPAVSGREAMRLVAEGRVRPDVLLTDPEMPGMGGVELAARVHAMRPAVRIVMMTGDAARAAAARERSAIVSAVLDKPILLADLLAAVRPDPEHVPT
jgi:CheY-like chemotaxis protein